MHLLKIIKKTTKTNLFISLVLLYLSIIIVFGFIYWRVANISSREFFVFQNDINMNIKINAFRSRMKVNIYSRDFNNAIRKLIVSEEYTRPLVKLLDDKENELHIFTLNKPLGELWANYYYLLLEGRGITHMKVESIKEKQLNKDLNVYKITLDLYKNNNEKYALYKNSDKINFDKYSSIVIWTKDSIDEESFHKDDVIYPLGFYFVSIMENSISFLDDSAIVLKEIDNGKFKYPLWNFLYFSVVTITTLGYGDILPNSTLVRTLVMFEVVSGVIIMGMFIPCLLWNKKN